MDKINISSCESQMSVCNSNFRIIKDECEFDRNYFNLEVIAIMNAENAFITFLNKIDWSEDESIRVVKTYMFDVRDVADWTREDLGNIAAIGNVCSDKYVVCVAVMLAGAFFKSISLTLASSSAAPIIMFNNSKC